MIPDAYYPDDATEFDPAIRPVTIVYYDPNNGVVISTMNTTLADVDSGELPGGPDDHEWAAKVVPGHDATTPIVGWYMNKVDEPRPIFPGEVAWLIHGNDTFSDIAEMKDVGMAALTAIAADELGLNCSVSIADMEDETWATFERRTKALYETIGSGEEVDA